jgi:hypothetical protein
MATLSSLASIVPDPSVSKRSNASLHGTTTRELTMTTSIKHSLTTQRVSEKPGQLTDSQRFCACDLRIAGMAACITGLTAALQQVKVLLAGLPRWIRCSAATTPRCQHGALLLAGGALMRVHDGKAT